MRIGTEQLAGNPPAFLRGRRLALLCNQASTDRNFRHSRDLVQAAFPGQLTCLFSPQHGFFSEKQDNMIESGHGVDPVSGLPVFSLYAERRKPTPEMFAGFDGLLVDLIDVGTRVYTFAWTVVYCLETAARAGREVVILDRPNQERDRHQRAGGRQLVAYHWPGNVRELENCIERAVLVCEGGAIHAHHLPPTLQTAEVSGILPRQSLAEALDVYEKDLVLDALKSARGNRAKAASLLDSTERIVNYKIRKYRIVPSRFRS